MSTVSILLSAFIISVIGLLMFIVSTRYGLLDGSQRAASIIFGRGEIGRPEEPAATGEQRTALETVGAVAEKAAAFATLDEDLAARAAADRSSSLVVFVFLCSAMLWLLVASLAGLTASLKLHLPDALASQAWLSFGRIRTIHLNAVAYGWAPMAGLGITQFVLPRVLKTPLVGGTFAVLGALLWNAGVVAGLGSIAAGLSDGLEWLEIPWQIGILFAVGGRLGRHPPGADTAGNPGQPSLCLRLVHGVRALLVPCAVPGGQGALRSFRGRAGDHELVVWA